MPPSPYAPLLKTRKNLAEKHDLLTQHHITLKNGDRLELLYIADKLMLNPDGLQDYCHNHPSPWQEQVLAQLLIDLNNELIPRWVRLRYQLSDPTQTTFLLEDRQPGWNRPDVLARLPLLS